MTIAASIHHPAALRKLFGGRITGETAMTDPAHRDAMESRRTPDTEREAVDRLANRLDNAATWTGDWKHESAAMLRALLARAEAAEAERDKLKMRAANSERMLDAAETALATARADGYAQGVRDAAGRDRIERLLKGWRLQHTADEDGFGYPLIDALSLTHADVSQGEDECLLIADAICGEILALLDQPAPIAAIIAKAQEGGE
jgi:hypothetical protein